MEDLHNAYLAGYNRRAYVVEKDIWIGEKEPNFKEWLRMYFKLEEPVK